MAGGAAQGSDARRFRASGESQRVGEEEKHGRRAFVELRAAARGERLGELRVALGGGDTRLRVGGFGDRLSEDRDARSGGAMAAGWRQGDAPRAASARCPSTPDI